MIFSWGTAIIFSWGTAIPLVGDLNKTTQIIDYPRSLPRPAGLS